MEHDRCPSCGRWREDDDGLDAVLDEAFSSEDVVDAIRELAADLNKHRRAGLFGSRTAGRARRCHTRHR